MHLSLGEEAGSTVVRADRLLLCSTRVVVHVAGHIWREGHSSAPCALLPCTSESHADKFICQPLAAETDQLGWKAKVEKGAQGNYRPQV